MSIATLRLRPLHPAFGAELPGLDLAAGLTPALLADLAAALAEHQLLLLRGQALDALELGALTTALAGAARPATVAAIPPGAGVEWAFDADQPTRPARVQALLATAAPTPPLAAVFASQVAALDSLSPWLAHRIEYLDAVTPAGTVPLVQIGTLHHHRGLFLPPDAIALPGVPAPEAASLLPRLHAAATDPAVTWHVDLRQHDLLLWDGHAVLHRLAPGGQDGLLRAGARAEAPQGAAAAAIPFLIAG